ncbi:hypothetical protein OSB04_022020 [Centaurea solstitialis]|uniref:Uncharacterized protein n=1 Tax=Centaurea solstitialis TaxID=347529 RepID=A0AA38TDP0_9ASTR|nr:hypothetical protein OSB04_022020 [Centaurea solstitialis]
MVLPSYVYKDCLRIQGLIDNNSTFDIYDRLSVSQFCSVIHDSEVEGKIYSGPMLWIGMYIAVASFFCILLMGADLLHGFRNRKLWFPSKYFTLNTASITIITIAMKLPVDLSSPMHGYVDQLAKAGSMTFMCTMMANLMPSLASMGNRELFTNVAGMVILVITIIVNVLIQMETGVVYSSYITTYGSMYLHMYINIGAMHALYTCTSDIFSFNNSNLKKNIGIEVSSVEELTQHVRKYWVMAGTCSPQFVMVTSPLCSAAGIICVTTAILHYISFVYIFIEDVEETVFLDYESDYKWSMLVIYITQTIGIGVETYQGHWTQMLTEWKNIHLAFPLGGHISKAFVHAWYSLILNLCIICQKLIVVSCKIIGLIPLAMVIVGVLCVYCWKSLKAKFFAMRIASNREIIPVVERNDTNEDIGKYALQLQDEVEVSIRMLKSISNSVNRSIQKAEKQLPVNIIQLIETFTGFKGVVNFDSDIQPLNCVKFPNGWSLPVVTLTCIAITLPNISQKSVDSLFNSVCEGLSYTFLVEKTLNNLGEYVKIHRATMGLWREVEVNYKWLGNTLYRNAYRDKNPKEILEWFADKAEKVIVEISKHSNEEPLDDSRDKLIVVDSMYRITQTILVNYPNAIEQNKEEQLFSLLSGMIVDILVACFTNLPRVIAMKCHEDAIEKREASVRDAAKLLGSTKKIIEKLQSCEIPTLDTDQRAFIDEWRVHLKQSIP